MRILVTGGAGFIGSQLCQALVAMDQDITVLDNFSSGNASKIPRIPNGRIRVIRGDCKNRRTVRRALSGVRMVYHLAANPEVRLDHSDPSTCYNNNIYATDILLEELKDSEAETIVFTSSSTVYGEAKLIPTPEDCGGLEPISVYGASKMASEALISAYCHTYKKKGVILRLANIIGPENGHGVVRDFLRQVKSSPLRLRILGNGCQAKSYLHIFDCVSGIIHAVKSSRGLVSVYNLGSEDQIEVRRIAEIVVEEAGLDNTVFEFAKDADEGRGWNGDVKNMLLDVSKLKFTGWRPAYASEEAVRLTVRSMLGTRLNPIVSYGRPLQSPTKGGHPSLSTSIRTDSTSSSTR